MTDLDTKLRKAVERCPHCGNTTGLEISAKLRYRCLICGGPRVPIVGASIARSRREAKPLARARSAQRWAFWYRLLWIAGGVLGGFSFSVTLLVLLLFSGLGSVWSLSLLFAALPLLVALWARQRSKRARKTAEAELDDAWTSVAHEILAAHDRALTSAELAELMLTSEAHADRLLARLNVDDRVFSHVTDEGQVTYSVRAPHRVRVQTESAEEDIPTAWDELERERPTSTKRS